MLNVTLFELMARGKEYLVAGDLGATTNKRHDILQLIAKPVRAS
jgi:hypothetical protein